MIQVTHRLTLSPPAVIELINGLNTTLTALREAQAQRAAASGAPLIGLEGIVSKRLGATYRSGRSPDWLKFKNPNAPAVKREAEEDWAYGQ